MNYHDWPEGPPAEYPVSDWILLTIGGLYLTLIGVLAWGLVALR